jgi:hypothetical protein
MRTGDTKEMQSRGRRRKKEDRKIKKKLDEIHPAKEH